MNVNELKQSAHVDEEPPKDLSPELKALWWTPRAASSSARTGTRPTRSPSPTRAIPVRLGPCPASPDRGRPRQRGYWYRKAGQPVGEGSHSDEWDRITEIMLAGRGFV